MPIYFLASNLEGSKRQALEARLRKEIPELKAVDSVEQLSQRLRSTKVANEPNYVLFSFSDGQVSIERLVEIANRGRDLLFFIFISDDIPANDYKLLVRTGNADWASSRSAAQEIRDIIGRHSAGASTPDKADRKPILVALLPSAGGVGNTTLAIEIAIQMRGGKSNQRSVCLVDLDFQTSHVCDLLDLEPRLQIEEISRHPDRLDLQLLDLFISHHASGLDVLAVPRNKQLTAESNLTALDSLFAMISRRYDFILADLPVIWTTATRQMLGVSDLAIVTGLDTVPGLRQVADTVKAIRELEHGPGQIIIALNRCQAGLFGAISSRAYVKRMLENETVFYVRDHSVVARESVNTGVPVSISSPSSKIVKDASKLATAVLELRGPGA